MSDEQQIEMIHCEYCQEYVPVDISTNECTTGCNNSLCPYDIYEDKNREKPLDFNSEEVREYEPEEGC